MSTVDAGNRSKGYRSYSDTSDTTEPLVLVGLYGDSTVLFCSALDAYNFLSIPICWLAQIVSLLCALWVFLNAGLPVIPGFKWALALLGWGALITLLKSVLGDYEQRMPPMATTAYSTFVGLRFVHLCAFVGQVYLCSWLLVKGKIQRVIKHTIVVGAMAAAFALYVYLAHRFGLPEPPRTRMGTSGGTQVVTFTFAFHRALGSFREPGAMASWMTVPFFLSFFLQRRLMTTCSVLTGTALLLSGSLSALGGSVLGMGASLILVKPFEARRLLKWVQLAIVLGVALFVFGCIAIANDDGTTNLFQVMLDRIRPLYEEGIAGTNRGYIQEFYQSVPATLTGCGLGNANILLSEYFRQPLMGSFLSFYRNVLYSTGWIGLLLLLAFLVTPLLHLWRIRTNPKHRFDLFVLGAAYTAWLFMFAFRSEEPPITFAIAYAFLAYAVSPARYSKVRSAEKVVDVPR